MSYKDKPVEEGAVVYFSNSHLEEHLYYNPEVQPPYPNGWVTVVEDQRRWTRHKVTVAYIDPEVAAARFGPFHANDYELGAQS